MMPSVPLRCFPDLSAFGSRFGSCEKRKNAASLFEDINRKKFLISQEIRNFFLFVISKVTRHFGVFRLTQTAIQTPIGQESTGGGRMASSVSLRLFFVGYMAWLMTLPMAFRIFSWVWRKESGANMVPVLGDTNRYRTGQFLENLLEDTPHDFLSLNVYRFDVADLYFSEI